MPRGVPRAGFRQPRNEPAQVVTLTTPAVVAPEVSAPSRVDALQRGHNIETMPEADLRVYARRIGLTQRDCDGLGVDRLRMNCKARLVELVEAD